LVSIWFYGEALPIAYGFNTFHFTYICQFQAFVRKTTYRSGTLPSGTSLINKVEFTLDAAERPVVGAYDLVYFILGSEYANCALGDAIRVTSRHKDMTDVYPLVPRLSHVSIHAKFHAPNAGPFASVYGLSFMLASVLRRASENMMRFDFAVGNSSYESDSPRRQSITLLSTLPKSIRKLLAAAILADGFRWHMYRILMKIRARKEASTALVEERWVANGS
jgi:hypothetical protein